MEGEEGAEEPLPEALPPDEDDELPAGAEAGAAAGAGAFPGVASFFGSPAAASLFPLDGLPADSLWPGGLSLSE